MNYYRLRACPFCGYQAEVFGCNLGHYVQCTNCKAKTTYYTDGLNTNDNSERMAVEAWNKRTGDEINEV